MKQANFRRSELALKKTLVTALTVSLSGLVSACGSKSASFDLLSSTDVFSQNAAEVNGKIDILWMVDNSGSMLTSQQAVADNFRRFIQQYQDKGFDFQIAVAATDGWMDTFNTSLTRSRFKTGSYTPSGGGSAVQAPAILTPSTPDLEQAFVANVMVGISGNGDERAFSSIENALENTSNQALGFPRADAFLSVIIVSDEEDFSQTVSSFSESYTNPNLISVAHYRDYLSELTGSTESNRKFNVSSIAIFDSDCRTALGGGVRKVAQRYRELTESTAGILGSLCDDFADTLATISNKVIELVTAFNLERIPQAGTLKVFVDGTEIAESSVDGYTYNAAANSITFHGAAIPPAGAAISVSFIPMTLL